jgi:hypothetical protein
MKFLGSTLLASFREVLPQNDLVVLDWSKPNKLVFLKCKEMNLHAMNLLTAMMSENNLMLMMVESVKSARWPDGLASILWEMLQRKFKSSDQVAKAKQTAKLLALKLKRNEEPEV